MAASSELDLNELAAGCGCITAAWGAGLAQAASVCLNAHGHEPPHPFQVSGSIAHRHTLRWLAVDDQMRRCFNDLDDAAEHGAYGIAALLIDRHTPFEVVDRSRKGTGFDYWLGPKGSQQDLSFGVSGRLEVSGIGHGTPTTVATRVRKKLKQTAPTDKLGLPAFVVVVEYGTPQAQVADK